MAEQRALDLALDFARMPALAAVMREQALPSDLLDVIRVAAGCPESIEAALAATQRPLREIQSAAILYLEEVLFFQDAGLHRNLGVSAGASKAQMRLHMRWLLQWLHPDHNSGEKAALLAAHVIDAWRELGRRDRSKEGGARRQPPVRQPAPNNARRRASARVPWIRVPIRSAPSARGRGQRAIIIALAAAAAAALLLTPDAVLFGWQRGIVFTGTSAAIEVGKGSATLVAVTHK